MLGILLAPGMLVLMNTPAEVLDQSIAYLQVYFAGMIPTLIYNMGTAILRSVGDSKRPLYFLIAASLLNVVLDFLFVLGFDMGVVGAAWATVARRAWRPSARSSWCGGVSPAGAWPARFRAAATCRLERAWSRCCAWVFPPPCRWRW